MSKSREDVTHDFEISKLVILTIQQAGKMMSLLVESLHMRIDSETVQYANWLLWKGIRFNITF